jgi:hypothetical protein
MSTFPQRGFQTRDGQVVDNPVGKVGGDNLAVFRLAGDEAGQTGCLIDPLLQVFRQLERVLFQSLLEQQGTPGVALASVAVQIRSVQAFKRKERNHHSPERRTHRTRLLLELAR